VFILPTDYDWFVITQLEPIAFGSPVIESAICGDVVENMGTNILMNQLKASNLVSIVKHLLGEPGCLDRFLSHVATKESASIDKLGQKLIDFVTATESRFS